MTDIIIPLGSGSKSNNDELRILLRSIEKNCTNAGRIFVVSDCAPDWLNDVVVVNKGDTYHNNKDANLIEKIAFTVKQYSLDRFCFCADDNVFNLPCDIDAIPVLYNSRSKEYFASNLDSKWRRRVFNTLTLCDEHGIHYKHNFESHCPQVFSDAQKLVNCIGQYDYLRQPGYSIMTYFRFLQGFNGGIEQSAFKETIENPDGAQKMKCDKMFVGYNDNGFLGGAKEKLFNRYSIKSHYEK